MNTIKIDTKKLATFAQDTHQNAVDKGWWQTDDKGKAMWESRDKGEILMLAVSELAEALEVWREGKPLSESWLGEKGKPEGFPVEMADFVIRAIETMTACGSNTEVLLDFELASLASFLARAQIENTPLIRSKNVGKRLIEITSIVAEIERLCLPWQLDAGGIFIETYAPAALAKTVILSFLMAEDFGFDLWSAMTQKHEYNKSRPRRHGGKLA